MSDMARGEPLVLAGDAFARGRAQSGAGLGDPVVKAIRLRLDERATLFAHRDIRAFLTRQWDFAEAHCIPEFAEMTGVAEGFGLAPRDLFDFLHLGIVADLAGTAAPAAADGCSAWAVSQSEDGPAVGKNRDFRGEHAGLQRVFLHSDPAWTTGRKLLCVGSLGAPGAYSSGMNSAGLALADTAVATTDHGVGWLRYFLMTRLLSRHDTVAAALDDIRSLAHAGGGSLVMADAGGALAAVDLGHRRVHCTTGARPWVARTNHFDADSVAGAPDTAASSSESAGRLDTLHRVLNTGQKSLAVLRTVMASHDRNGASGLCRHPTGETSRTLSGAVFACSRRLLYFCPGNPCETEWLRYSMDG